MRSTLALPARFRVREPLAPLAARRHGIPPIGYVDTPFGRQAIFPVRGATSPGGGYGTEGDLVTATIDGVDLNTIWVEMQQSLGILNERRSAVTALLSYRTTVSADAVMQSVQGTNFERASEFGVPRSARVDSQPLILGYPFDDYDVATRYTWRFLRDAPQSQVDAVHASVLEADNRHTSQRILRRLLNNANESYVVSAGAGTEAFQTGRTVYALWNADGIAPPNYQWDTFAGTHTHYLATDGDLTLALHEGDGVSGPG